MTGDLILQEKFYVGSGAPVTGDEITANTSAYPINTNYLDKTNGASYVRTGVGKVTGDWTQIGAASYSVYTALLTQSGTSAPVATVLQNTLGGTIVWSREAAGDYFGTLAGAFVSNKTHFSPFGNYAGAANTFLPIWAGSGAILGYWTLYIDTQDSIGISVINTAGTQVDLSTLVSTCALMLPDIRIYR